MARKRGFTLIELMIVVLVIAVLAMIALSGYSKQLRKSRRAEARQAIADLSLREEKWRSNNATYGTCDNLVTSCNTYNTSFKYYSVAISFPSSGNCPSGTAKGNGNSYIVTATPKSSTDQVKDTACSNLILTNDCGTVQKTASSGSADCW